MNRLALETSPYLLQHAHNPVDWYPWGPEALERARAERRPILLSVGYSACHWCHVMAHESFEDPAVAAVMNEHFVNVKVDREERPDLDELYMRAVQAFTGGRGGWPMTVFLTPDGEPFFGGTYFPPRPAHGMPSFSMVLEHVAKLWSEGGPKLGSVVGQVKDYLASAGRLPRAEGSLSDDWLLRLSQVLGQEFDEQDGGFGGAPKFPPHGALSVLLAHHHRTGDAQALRMARATLDAMAQGGMYDLIAGGFARYSVDKHWRVPHFEKMLYDNALLVPLYADAWALTREPVYERVVRETIGWVMREMALPDGGFASALDADSEGEEGKFYVWTPAQIREAVGLLEGMRVSALLGVTDAGSFEHGTSVLRMEVPRERFGPAEQELLARAFPALLEARERRTRPGRDDKVLTSWNALMITALAHAGAVFDVAEWRDAAARCARFLLTELRPAGRLLRTWKDGRAHVLAFADDHAFLTNALAELYEATFDPFWLREANHLADTTVELFWDEAEGGLFFAGSDAEALLTRSKHLLGGAEPSANGVAALAFSRLAELSGRSDLGELADRILLAYQPLVDRAPRAIGVEAVASAWRTGPVRQLGFAGPSDTLVRAARSRFLPFAVWGHGGSELLPWMEGKSAIGGEGTAYLCEHHTCQAPTRDPEELLQQLDGGPRRAPRAPTRMRAPALPAEPEAWIGEPLTLEKLRGNVVILDFWTYCCINCMHVLPELAKLEERLAGQPVAVIGVHAAKFAAERERENVEGAVARHGVRHPVVLDPRHTVWQSYAIRSWPTVVVLDTSGRIAWQKPGEVSAEELEPVVRKLLDEARADGTLGAAAWRRPPEPDRVDGLAFPGKITVHPDLLGQAHGQDPFADGRVYIADTGNHRVVEAALSLGPDGWPVLHRRRVFGGNGPGLVDGPGTTAWFRGPQGLARTGDALWVADTDNHAIRRVDLRTGQVSTVAGTGRLNRGIEGDGDDPRSLALRSPWDVAAVAGPGEEPDAVFIAMAGAHQIWVYLVEADRIGPLCGSGAEDHVDGPPQEAALAQPSGLAAMGRYVFFADSETSSIRVFDLGERRVGTLVGKGLFDFGDVDGGPDEALLQHPLAVAAAEGELYVADTFNHKIKAIDLHTGIVRTVTGGDRSVLCEPGGIAVAGPFLLVADTNNHRIRAVARETGEVRDVVWG